MKLLKMLTVFFAAAVALASATPIQNTWQEVVDPESFFNVAVDVTLTVHTRGNQAGMVMGNNANTIRNSHWSAQRDTKIIIHGHNHSATHAHIVGIRDAYIRRGDFNVIVVDWRLGTTGTYAAVRARVRPVGEFIGNYIDWLHQNALTSFHRVSIIGHHFGAHVAGIAGKTVTRGRIQSIYGLDPPSNSFHVNTPTERFASTDALYTEGVITSGGAMAFSDPNALGQSNFYANRGFPQPGCGPDRAGTCSTMWAANLFAESINNDQFWAIRCNTWTEVTRGTCPSPAAGLTMGGEPGNVPGTLGMFNFDTNSVALFARGPV